MVTEKIEPNCRCVDILFKILKDVTGGIEQFSINHLILCRIKEIQKFAPEDFIDISKILKSNEKIKLVEKPLKFTQNHSPALSENQFRLFKNGFVKSFQFKTDGEISTAGGFPLMLEEYFLLSCEVSIDDKHSDTLKRAINSFNFFRISEIKNFELSKYDKNFCLYLHSNGYAKPSSRFPCIFEVKCSKCSTFDGMSEAVEKLLFHLGTNTFLKKSSDSDEQIEKIISTFEDNITEQLRAQLENVGTVTPEIIGTVGQILMMLNMLKYNHYRVNVDPEEEKRKKVEEIPGKIKEKIKNIIDMPTNTIKGLEHFQYNRLMHHSYLKGMIDGENYNYLRGKEIISKHSKKAAVAAIMSRNMSHNIGSHVLSSIPLDEIEKKKYDISKFNSYLQQRMDFLARISTEWPATGEYLCFYTDLMRNFLKQSLLLEKIIKDDGVEGKNIKIHLKVNNSSPITFTRDNESHHKNKEEANCNRCKGENDKCGECEHDYRIEGKGEMNAKDLLIQLPGGMLGTQAFYIILENIMRNSAKYNKKSREYEIYIEIGENKDLKTGKDNDLSYTVRIYDNFSKNKNRDKKEKNGKTGTLVQLLQEKLEKPLIKGTGEIIEKDWGIQEIKIAAQFLNHPFKEEEIGISIKENDHKKKYVWVEECERNVGGGNDGKKTKLASYVFSIPKAKLVLCVNHHKKEEIKKAEGRGVFAADLEDFTDKMKKLSPEMLYFEINEGDFKKAEKKFGDALKEIKDHKFFLPTRIVVAVNKKFKVRLKKILESCISGHKIPPRRLIICPLEGIAEINGDDSIESFIISVYKQWVFRWHKKELMKGENFKNVGIVIYFDRDKEFTGFSRWKALKGKLAVFGLTNIKFSFFDKSQNAMDISDFSDSHQEAQDIDFLLGFDNHGVIKDKFKETKNWNFYQIIGHDSTLKMNNHSMFNLLQDVPPGFAGAMFVLSLIESAFTRVGIVDERVANWAFEEIDEEFLFKHEGVIPQNILGANLFISASVKVKKRHQLVGKEKGKAFKLISENKKGGEKEGITKNKFRFLMGKEIKTIKELDILIIHLGFLDEIFEKDKDKDKEEWLMKLHRKIPKIVMISGRGYKPDEVPLELPFREASLVTNYINTDFNKLNLVKGLISPRGNIHAK